ncbi:hypothetical protein ACSQ67_005828 [Phaseolus vulgaris]
MLDAIENEIFTLLDGNARSSLILSLREKFREERKEKRVWFLGLIENGYAAWGSLWRLLTKGSGFSQDFTLTVPKQAASTTILHLPPTTTPMAVSTAAPESKRLQLLQILT